MQKMKIWLLDGTELEFESVRNFKIELRELMFEYRVHTGLMKENEFVWVAEGDTYNASFDLDKILGYAISQDDTRSELDGLIKEF